jgi:GtrA-like protein
MPFMMLDFRDYFRKALKFMVIGAIGAVINWALLYFFVQYLNVWYLTAEIIATIIVFGVNFNGNILVKNIKIRKGPEIGKTKPTPLKPEEVGK